MRKLSILFILLAVGLVSFSSVPPRHKLRSSDVSKSLAFPVAGKQNNIESFWGASRGGGTRKHKGIDVYARKGTPVVAISDGIIVKKTRTLNGGKTLWLKPTHAAWTAYYAHLDKRLVKRGQRVRKGDVIGTVGNSGNARHTPSHLHFGISPGKGWVNPLPYVKHSKKVNATHSVTKKSTTQTSGKKVGSR